MKGREYNMDVSRYEYLWKDEKDQWVLVDSPYGYGIVNVQSQSILMVSDPELKRNLIKKMEEAGCRKYSTISAAYGLDNDGSDISQDH